MKPLFIWAGGKNKMLKHYRGILPDQKEIDSYVEPFFGGGAMFIHMKNNYNLKKYYINDINPSIVSIYECIKNEYKPFEKRLKELEKEYLSLGNYPTKVVSKPGFLMTAEDKVVERDIRILKDKRKKFYLDVRHKHAYDYESWTKPYEAGTLYFLMKTGFNGIFQMNKNTNGRYGTPSGLLNQKDKVFDYDVIKWWNKNLKNVEIGCGNWNDNIPEWENAFYFFDPPYRDSFANYGNAFSDDQLKEMIEFANSRKYVFLSNRDGDDGWFDKKKLGLSIERFPITYTAGRRKQIKKGDKIEKFEAKKATEILLYKPKKKNKPKKKKQGTMIDSLYSMCSSFLNKVSIKLDIPKKYSIS